MLKRRILTARSLELKQGILTQGGNVDYQINILTEELAAQRTDLEEQISQLRQGVDYPKRRRR